jgi:hypothetical protein
MNKLEKVLQGAKNIAQKTWNNSRKYATGIAFAGALSASSLTAPRVDAATNGFTTWDTILNGGITNTIKSGDLINLNIIQGTTSNVYSDLIKFTIGTSNAMTNNLQLRGSSYFNTSNGTVTNGFYNGKTFDMDPLLMYTKNMGSYFQTELHLTSGQSSSGTGDVMQLQFQAFNNGPTNILVPVQITATTIGRSGGTWAYPGTWSTKSTDYGNSAYSYINIVPIPEPSAGALVLGGLGLLALGQHLRRKKR